jgi:membrane-associated phospholipid phosphatase
MERASVDDTGSSGDRKEDRRRPPLARHAVDVVVGAGCALVLVLTWFSALGGVTAWERDLFWSMNRGPTWIRPLVDATMWLGLLGAVPLAAIAAAVARRYRLAIALVASGSLAYVGARLIKDVLGRGRPLDVFGPGDVIVPGPVQTGLGYPSGHAAIAAALAAAAIPYVAVRFRWLLVLLPLMVAYDRVYVGAHLPLDVVGGLALGVLAAMLMHVIMRRPSVTGRERRADAGRGAERGDAFEPA